MPRSRMGVVWSSSSSSSCGGGGSKDFWFSNRVINILFLTYHTNIYSWYKLNLWDVTENSALRTGLHVQVFQYELYSMNLHKVYRYVRDLIRIISRSYFLWITSFRLRGLSTIMRKPLGLEAFANLCVEWGSGIPELYSVRDLQTTNSKKKSSGTTLSIVFACVHSNDLIENLYAQPEKNRRLWKH
jgi:hypothetical protein